MNTSRGWCLASVTGLAGAMLSVTPARADIEIMFREGAPKDRIIIRNQDACSLPRMSLTIDLTPSAGGLIFDTVPGGAGIDVAQPLELESGAARIEQMSTVGDGDRQLLVVVSHLDPREAITLTIDLDDTLTTGLSAPTRVSGGEIAGTLVTVQLGDNPQQQPLTASFAPDANAVLRMSSCLS